ncbi:hypothetical protein CLHUN_15070 [Ruminiclostridium hungatei]|uniref:CAAX prenyl protease 2/Lysostaphin resistance protein A-like domain-containing protein n=1 Tax=Ruminiclostridium hungatei TaxID=48256 RepID=A0A1V4SL27_RUMHU|nr:CPBP family intramembrane glutamic endopeptidase [Ruminiclostridium hungatei]OPX44514.1 hypothetical protein CLHUN_15070 [Ruminiclostridium hungatei]
MKKAQITTLLKGIFFALSYLLIYTLNSKFISIFMNYASETKFKGVVESLNNTVSLEMILNVAIPVLVYVLIFRIRKINLLTFCKFKTISIKNLMLCISIGISISIFILCFMHIKYFAHNLQAVISFFDRFNNGSVFYFIFYNIIVFTIFEEMLFRGLIFNELRKVLPLVPVIIIQALPAAFQSDMVLSVFGYASMLIYCLAYICSDSIWGSVAVLYTSHIFVMLSRRAGIDKWLSNLDNSILITGTGISILITVSLLFYMWKSYSHSSQTSEISRNKCNPVPLE